MAKVDVVSFEIVPNHRSCDPRARHIQIVINGRDLVAILYAIELRQTSDLPDVAGAYQGRDPDYTWYREEFFPVAEPRTAKLLVCGDCGHPDCWAFTARIEVLKNTVRRSEFQQTAGGGRPGDWDYSELGRFVFEREQYEAAVGQLPP